MSDRLNGNPLIADEFEARRLLVAIPLPKDGPLDDDQRQQVIATLSNYMTRHGLGNQDVSRNCKSLSMTTVSELITGAYQAKHPNKVDEHLRTLNQFMEADARRRAGARAKRPLTTTFVVRLVRTAVDMCIQNATMGYVTGPAGIGKTATLTEIERTHPGVSRIGVNMTNTAVHAMARAIATKLKVGGQTRRQDLRGLDPFERIVTVLKGSHRLLVFDDAHKLRVPTLEMLRELHDECGVGILLVGAIDLATKIHMTTDNDHGQLESRFGVRLDVLRAKACHKTGEEQPLFTIKQIREIFALPGLRLVGGALMYLKRLANEPGRGGVRICEHLVYMAIRAVRKRNDLRSTQYVTVSEHELREMVRSCNVMGDDAIYKECYAASQQAVPEPAAKTA